tara:strand:+ start:546 stop:914 length:369 start_codon:yes stop_codon:yes gene_type:complete
LIPKKFNEVNIIITVAIEIDIKFKLKLKINFPPINNPKKRARNIGKNRKLPIPFLTSICKKFVNITGKHRSIIAFVGGNIKAIIGTENIDIPMPTDPFTIPPIKTDKIINIKFSISRYSDII